MTEPIAFSADWHIGHKNILALGAGRPFNSIEEHDAAVVENVNKTIPNGRLYFLGDLAFGGRKVTIPVLRQIRADFYWILGNHDPEHLAPEVAEHVTWAGHIKNLKVDDQLIVMCHFPMLTWEKAHYGSWMLHGHSHNGLAPTTQPRLDVGVDGHNMTPWLYEEVVEVMRDRAYKPVDHHQ